jgi:hypothetical protein
MKTQTEQSTIINNQITYTSSGLSQSCGHKVRYEQESSYPLKVATPDKPDTLPKDHSPRVLPKVTVAFAVEEWFQILLVHMNNPHNISTKVLEPMRAF